MKFILAGFLILSSTAAMASFTMIQYANNSAGPGGFLTGTDGTDFLLNNSAGKLFAR